MPELVPIPETAPIQPINPHGLQEFGGDWPTPDGSGVFDYTHVMDLAEGHRAALDTLLSWPGRSPTPTDFNLTLNSC